MKILFFFSKVRRRKNISDSGFESQMLIKASWKENYSSTEYCDQWRGKKKKGKKEKRQFLIARKKIKHE